MTTNQFSSELRELIAKARIVSFDSWKGSHPSEIIDSFQTADNEGRYLTDIDLERVETAMPALADSIGIARILRDAASEIVDEARGKVLTEFPDITQPGGGLYPPKRAENCWRDFWHFLRCITYGIAGDNVDYTSSEGFHYMNLLYQELQVPLDAMVLGLEEIKTASLQRITGERAEAIAPYFDSLIDQLKQFKSEPTTNNQQLTTNN